MQHDWTHVERPGESHTALDGKNKQHSQHESRATGLSQLQPDTQGNNRARTSTARSAKPRKTASPQEHKDSTIRRTWVRHKRNEDRRGGEACTRTRQETQKRIKAVQVHLSRPRTDTQVQKNCESLCSLQGYNLALVRPAIHWVFGSGTGLWEDVCNSFGIAL